MRLQSSQKKLDDPFKAIYINIVRNINFYWIYFLFSTITILYFFTLYFRIDIFNVGVYSFIFGSFVGWNLYFNLGLVFGISFSIFWLLSGLISSFNLFLKLSMINSLNKNVLKTFVYSSILSITIIGVIFHQVVWVLLFKDYIKYVETNNR